MQMTQTILENKTDIQRTEMSLSITGISIIECPITIKVVHFYFVNTIPLKKTHFSEIT